MRKQRRQLAAMLAPYLWRIICKSLCTWYQPWQGPDSDIFISPERKQNSYHMHKPQGHFSSL